jgi:hypothetical protein
VDTSDIHIDEVIDRLEEIVRRRAGAALVESACERPCEGSCEGHADGNRA